MSNNPVSSKAPWDEYDDELDSNIRFPNAPEPEKFHETSSSETKEVLAERKEMNIESVKKFRFENQDELADKDRFGKIMHHREFMRRLNTILPARMGASNSPGLCGLAVEVPTMNGGEWKYACAMQLGYAPEYSTLHIDDHGLPLNEKFRGWRTVILRLIQNGFITEEQADRAFGPPTSGPISRRYKEQMYCWRNRPQTV